MTIHKRTDVRGFTECSGPNVWPRLYAERVVDRFIFRQPELRYLMALEGQARFWKEHKDLAGDPDQMVINFFRIRGHGTSRRYRIKIGKFVHPIQKSDPVDDVRDFLTELRNYLRRCMPDKQLFGQAIHIQFSDPIVNKKVYANFTESWT